MSSAVEFLNFFRETRNKPEIEVLRKKHKGEIFFVIDFLNEAKYIRILQEFEKDGRWGE